MYQLVTDKASNETLCIKRLADNAFIPFDPANTDYQKYLECSVFLGNGDDPIINEKFSMKDIVKEFIDVRSSKLGFDKMYDQQRDMVIKTLEKSIEALKKAA